MKHRYAVFLVLVPVAVIFLSLSLSVKDASSMVCLLRYTCHGNNDPPCGDNPVYSSDVCTSCATRNDDPCYGTTYSCGGCAAPAYACGPFESCIITYAEAAYPYAEATYPYAQGTYPYAEATYPYAQGTYGYSQSSYYAQSTYYGQAAYYAQAAYAAPPPTVDNVTISSPLVTTDNTTQYNITITGSDSTGSANITHEYVLINLQGENAPLYRGYLTWYYLDAWNGYQDYRACTGGGHAAVQPGYGDANIHLDACTTSVSGNSRTTVFTVRFQLPYTTPVIDNDISGYLYNGLTTLSSGWVNFQTNFNLLVPAPVADITCQSNGAGAYSNGPCTVDSGASTNLRWCGGASNPCPNSQYCALATSAPSNATWQNVTALTVTGNTLTKTGGTNNVWDAGASSTQTIASGDGYVEFTTVENTAYKMGGFSSSDTTPSYVEMKYALYAAGDGHVYIIENAAFQNGGAAVGTYVAGDIFRVAIQKGVVKYFKNGMLLFTSPNLPTYPLLFDSSFYSIGATLSNVHIGTGLVSPTAANVQWQNILPSANITVGASSITKTGGVAAWDTGASSIQTISSGDGYVEFVVGDTTKYKIAGLGNGDSNQSYTDIDYGIYPNVDGNLYIFEGGSLKAGPLAAYTAGDLLRVAVEFGTVKYYQNGNLLYTSTVPPTYPLGLDTSLYDPGTMILSAKLYNGQTSGTYSTGPITTPSKTFYLTCVDPGGNSTDTAITINANAATADATCQSNGAGAFSNGPCSVNSGTSTNLRWCGTTGVNCSSVDSCTISPGPASYSLQFGVAGGRPESAEQIVDSTTLNLKAAIGSPLSGDFNGDGLTDLAIFNSATSGWTIDYSPPNGVTDVTPIPFTLAYSPYYDVPTMADFTGDGKTDIGEWRSGSGPWYVLTSESNYTSWYTVLVPPSPYISWGLGATPTFDLAVPGDYTGDGKADLAVWRSGAGQPDTGYWYVLNSDDNNKTYFTRAWGTTGDVPVQADYTGDGKTDMAVWRPSSTTWWVLTSNSNWTAGLSYTLALATATDIPVPADYTGDGKADLAVYRPSTGDWFIYTSESNYTASYNLKLGIPGDVPVPGYYHSKGKAEVAVWRPSNQKWYFINGPIVNTSLATANLIANTTYTLSCNGSAGIATDQVTVNVAVPTPSVSNMTVTVNNGYYCSAGVHATVSGIYTDPGSLNAINYQAMIDNDLVSDPNVASASMNPEWESGTVPVAITSGSTFSSSTSNCPVNNSTNVTLNPTDTRPQTTCQMVWNTTYTAWGRVQNSSGVWSPWVKMSTYINGVNPPASQASWTTPVHAFPQTAFTYSPASPVSGSPVTFTDSTVFAPSSSGKTWSWNFGTGVPTPAGTGTQGPYSVVFTGNGSFPVSLTATDNAGSCTYQNNLYIGQKLPQWREVAPY